MMNFNIQLFADNLQNTTATMSKEMKTFYEKRLIDQAEPRLVHDQFADYYPVPPERRQDHRVPQVRQPAQGHHA